MLLQTTASLRNKGFPGGKQVKKRRVKKTLPKKGQVVDERYVPPTDQTGHGDGKCCERCS